MVCAIAASGLQRSWVSPTYRLSYADADELIDLAPPQERDLADLHGLLESLIPDEWLRREFEKSLTPEELEKIKKDSKLKNKLKQMKEESEKDKQVDWEFN